jgi:uncharacterized protein
MIEQTSSKTHSELEKLEGEKCICIESYRRNHEPVRTPVWFVIDRGHLYVRTGGKTGKVKRIRGNSRVRIAACSFSGKLKGDWIDASASIGTEDEERSAFTLLPKKYGLQYRLTRFLQRLFGGKGVPVVLRITL